MAMTINSVLPNDVLACIFAHFGIASLGQLERVCKRWKYVLGTHPQLWRDLLSRQEVGPLVKHGQDPTLYLKRLLRRSDGRIDRWGILMPNNLPLEETELYVLQLLPHVNLHTLVLTMGADEGGGETRWDTLQSIEQKIVLCSQLKTLHLIVSLASSPQRGLIHVDVPNRLCTLEHLVILTSMYVPFFFMQPSCKSMFCALRFLAIWITTPLDPLTCEALYTNIQHACGTLVDLHLSVHGSAMPLRKRGTDEMDVSTQKPTVIIFPRLLRASIYFAVTCDPDEEEQENDLVPSFEFSCPILEELILDCPSHTLIFDTMLSSSLKMLAASNGTSSMPKFPALIEQCTSLSDLQLFWSPHPMTTAYYDCILSVLAHSPLIPLQRLAINPIHVDEYNIPLTAEIIPCTRISAEVLFHLVFSRLGSAATTSLSWIVLEDCHSLEEEQIRWFRSNVEYFCISFSRSMRGVAQQMPNIFWSFQRRLQRRIRLKDA